MRFELFMKTKFSAILRTKRVSRIDIRKREMITMNLINDEKGDDDLFDKILESGE